MTKRLKMAARSKILLLIFYINKGNYWIYNKPIYNKDEDCICDTDQQLWITIREYKDSASSLGYKLNENDILKFGRAKIRVLKIHYESQEQIDQNSKLKADIIESKAVDVAEELNEIESFDEDANTCRICFLEGSDAKPLASTCKCSGSLKYVHIECLRWWMSSKRTMKETDQSVIYSWKSFECELCKTLYSESAKQKYCLINYESPFSSYIALECSNSNNANNVFVLNLNNNKTQFKIGRGHDSDIRISDISVSRLHAMIHRDGKDFILKDNNSKFGSLVCIRKPLLLSDYSSIHLQLGRTLFQIYMGEKPDWSLNGCFWINQGTMVSKPKKIKYLSCSEAPDAFIPNEFMPYLKKEISQMKIRSKIKLLKQMPKKIEDKEIIEKIQDEAIQTNSNIKPIES